jgi:hypothetical protein
MRGGSHTSRPSAHKTDGQDAEANLTTSGALSASSGLQPEKLTVCRKNSMNVYLDPKIPSVTVNIDTANVDDAYTETNNQNWCFSLTQSGRSVASAVRGIYIWEKYDKLQLASQGDQCNSK